MAAAVLEALQEAAARGVAKEAHRAGCWSAAMAAAVPEAVQVAVATAAAVPEAVQAAAARGWWWRR